MFILSETFSTKCFTEYKKDVFILSETIKCFTAAKKANKINGLWDRVTLCNICFCFCFTLQGA